MTEGKRILVGVCGDAFSNSHFFENLLALGATTYGHGLRDKEERRGGEGIAMHTTIGAPAHFFLPKLCGYSFLSPRFPPTQPQAEGEEKKCLSGKKFDSSGRVDFFEHELLERCEAAQGEKPERSDYIPGGEKRARARSVYVYDFALPFVFSFCCFVSEAKRQSKSARCAL